MKRLVLLHLVGFLALALDSGEASTLFRRRSTAEKPAEKNAIEEPYICVDRSVSLPACYFGKDATDEKASRTKRSGDQLEVLKPIESEISTQKPVTEGGQSRGLLIIYQMEGCMPPRLPFRHPDCKEEDKEGRRVQLYKLRTFVIPSASTGPPPFVFPEIDEEKRRQLIISSRQRELGQKEDVSNLEKSFNKFLLPPNEATVAEFEAKRLKMLRQGSEFPYDSAISYNAKKLEDRREKTKRDADQIPVYSGDPTKLLIPGVSFYFVQNGIIHIVPYDALDDSSESHAPELRESFERDELADFEVGISE